jgi:hypothetical protein
MHFQEITEGDYRIFVGALESPRGDGYTAALVVQHAAGIEPRRRDAFRDDSLACGHRWASADDAMSYALRKGRELIRKQPATLAH